MKVLLIGNGAREHAIAESLTKSGRNELAVFAKARNPGIAALASDYHIGSLKDFDSMKTYARRLRPDFAVIGPDDPIADGVADLLLEDEIHSVAPLKTVARLESSKSFTRDLVKKYNIPGNPAFRVFYDDDGLEAFINVLADGFVVKADGLMGGKGVKVSGDHLANIAEGLAYARECLAATGRVVIEEKLVGQEFSLMSFCDGNTVVDMPCVQDHKRAFEGDTGPNTGGMGSYSDANHLLPFLSAEDVARAHEITVRVADALFRETGVQFRGVMYGGFMAVKDGVRLIEYNARFGDPEAMNVLPILKTDFVDICQAIIHGELKNISVHFEKKATVCKYIVPEGYPDEAKSGEKITIDSPHGGARIYYSSVDEKNGAIFLSSSRAVAFVGIADDIPAAEKIAEQACGTVRGPVFYRRDIGTTELIAQRVEAMRKLRNESI